MKKSFSGASKMGFYLAAVSSLDVPSQMEMVLMELTPCSYLTYFRNEIIEMLKRWEYIPETIQNGEDYERFFSEQEKKGSKTPMLFREFILHPDNKGSFSPDVSVRLAAAFEIMNNSASLSLTDEDYGYYLKWWQAFCFSHQNSYHLVMR